MLIVKITTSYPENPESLLRQTPGESGVWNNIQFFINNDSIKICDYWIVYEGLTKREEVICPKENVVLITGEPPSVKKYNNQFVKQFSKVITCHRDLEHENKIYWQQALSWFIGKTILSNYNEGHRITYDYFKNKIIDSNEKNKICSVISSNLKISQGHLDRLQFIDILLNHFGDKIDVFGRGFNDIVDKWDAIVPYKYHIVIENSSFEDYWTEKLADAFLGESYPIYYGAKNINSYFDKESLATIDINKPEEAVKIIEEAINGNYYEKYKNQIIKSKNKVLDEYNLFPTIISKVIDKNTKIYEKSKINIKPEIYFQINLLKKIKLILRKKRIINRIWSKYRKLRPKNI